VSGTLFGYNAVPNQITSCDIHDVTVAAHDNALGHVALGREARSYSIRWQAIAMLHSQQGIFQQSGMNFTALQKEIGHLSRAQAKLEAKLQAARTEKLKAMPEQVGLSSIAELIGALKGLSKSQPGRKARAVTRKTPSRGRRTRAVITDQMRSEVKKLVEAGKTGQEIATAVGISLPSVQNVKKALGLVAARKK
jgi:hypothetical protein